MAGRRYEALAEGTEDNEEAPAALKVGTLEAALSLLIVTPAGAVLSKN
jgi:hypothetical protein